MSNVLPFKLPDPEPAEKIRTVWRCGCGSYFFVLFEDGAIFCPECQDEDEYPFVTIEFPPDF